jgi:oxygen-independent coproporphyrinogen III oxidase
MTYSLYFHIPFCTHRCAYCDFNTYAGQEALIPAYVEALCNEIRLVAGSAQDRLPIHTIYFGGGTPSLLAPQQFEQILQTVRTSFNLVPIDASDTSGPSKASDASEPLEPSNTSGTSGASGTSGTFSSLETSLEANPGTVTFNSLQGLQRVGFNRISFGVQSFHADELRQLERIHDPFDVMEAVRWARKAGFGNLNLDLIFGLPEQTLSRWQESLRQAVDLAPEHLSLYALTIEHGTLFGRWAERGLMPMPDPDLAADMYDAASDYLATQGYEQYEISNWSKPGFQCRHNLQYWCNQPYLGFGAGAHGCTNDLRISNVLRIKTYLNHLSPYFPSFQSSDFSFPLSPATVNQTRITPYIEMQETMLLGLRLTHEGVSTQAFQTRFGQDPVVVFGKEINELVQLGLLEWVNSPRPSGEGQAVRAGGSLDAHGAGVRVRLTRRGRLLGNQVFMRFVG